MAAILRQMEWSNYYAWLDRHPDVCSILFFSIMKEKGDIFIPPFLRLITICYLFLFLVLKDLFQRYSEGVGNLKGKFDGWNILPLLKCDNSLPGAAGTVSQLFLRHLVIVETQPSDTIYDLRHCGLCSSNPAGYRGIGLGYQLLV